MSDGRRARATLVWLATLLALTACAESSDGEDTDTTQDTPRQEETVTEGPTPNPGPSQAPDAATPQARQAVADLARRLGVAEDEIAVRSVEAVTWRDGSLGCAKKGVAYTQALVEGSRITLEAGGRAYEYHAGGQRAPFHCESPTQ